MQVVKSFNWAQVSLGVKAVLVTRKLAALGFELRQSRNWMLKNSSWIRNTTIYYWIGFKLWMIEIISIFVYFKITHCHMFSNMRRKEKMLFGKKATEISFSNRKIPKLSLLFFFQSPISWVIVQKSGWNCLSFWNGHI